MSDEIEDVKDKAEKPNCYKCKHRGTVPGTAHICCEHPDSGLDKAGSFSQMMATFASVGRVAPVRIKEGAKNLGIVGNLHGIRHHWFNWPFNFDPVWLEACNGFELKEA